MYKFLAMLVVLVALASTTFGKPQPQVLLDYGYYSPAAYVSAYSSPVAYSYPYAYAYSYPYAYV